MSKIKIRRICKCGCGRITNPGRKYICGHNSVGNVHNKGVKKSKETRKNMSIAKQNISDETKRKMSISQIGNTNAKGAKRTEETKLKISLSRIKCNPNYEYDDSWQDREYRRDLRKDYCENVDCKRAYKQLDNHHIDLNKKNGKPFNIITLCKGCHVSLHRRLSPQKNDVSQDFIVINRLDHISYINKKTRKKITIKRIIQEEE